MPIDKIGSTENYAIVRRNYVKPRLQQHPVGQDTISLTKAAQHNADMLRVRDLALSAPDTRSEKIVEMQGKLQDPAYPDQAIIVKLADRLIDQWHA